MSRDLRPTDASGRLCGVRPKNNAERFCSRLLSIDVRGPTVFRKSSTANGQVRGHLRAPRIKSPWKRRDTSSCVAQRIRASSAIISTTRPIRMTFGNDTKTSDNESEIRTLNVCNERLTIGGRNGRAGQFDLSRT